MFTNQPKTDLTIIPKFVCVAVATHFNAGPVKTLERWHSSERIVVALAGFFRIVKTAVVDFITYEYYILYHITNCPAVGK